ncbi:flavin reductase family protein [Candidatus Hodarchaeum mangrovi]
MNEYLKKVRKIKQSIENLDLAYRFLYPRLTIIVSCGTMEKANALTIAWSTPLSVNPPLMGISITKKRFSHQIIKNQGEFVINIPNFSQVDSAYYLGTISGREDTNKIIKAGFTLERSSKIDAPKLKECLINIECKLIEIVPTGDHDLFIGEVINLTIEETIRNDWGIDIHKFANIYWRQSKRKDDIFILSKISSSRKENNE